MIVREAAAIVIVCAVLFVAAVGLIASRYSGKDDGPIEEAAEEFIDAQTGMNVDLTPDTKET